jgi:hypothetical protein
MEAEGIDRPPDAIIEAFRRTFYCGAAAAFSGLVAKDYIDLDVDFTREELKEFGREMRTP